MTIDEAIAKYKKLADNDRTCYPEEAQQLAEWLEELKSYRASVFSGYMTQKMLKEEYNKAIDDFVKLVHKHDWNIRNINENSFIYGAIDTLAEQLKAGGENEESI